MFARLRLRLDADIHFRQCSLLQGALMERLDTQYADKLHESQLHPYSQYVTPAEEGGTWWIIQTLDGEAYENIVKPWMAGSETIALHHGGEKQLVILERRIETLPKSKLVEDFYSTAAEKRFTVQFLTPTAFRQRRRYVILPDIRLLCQSMMMKYSASSYDVNMVDEEALDELAAETFITRHRIRSLPFPAEGQSIPGFVGTVTFECRGTETMARYLRLLFSFGEFSGVGVKTAMGMGAVRVFGGLWERSDGKK